MQNTVFDPYANKLPDAGLQDTVVAVPLGSDPVAVKFAVVEGALPDVGSVKLLGQDTAGGRNMMDVTKNVQDLEFKALSNAVHVTKVAPEANVAPLGGTHDVFKIPDPSVADEEMS